MRSIARLLVAVLLVGCSDATEDAAAHLAKAHAALDKADRGAAVVALQAAVQARPTYAEARYLLGRTLYERSEPRAAQPELERAIELGFPRDIALPLLIRATARAGKAQEAAQRYRDADLGSPGGRAEHAVAMATVWDLLADRAKVKAALASALAADPTHLEAQVLSARLLAAEGQFEKAWAAIETVLAAAPRSATAWQTQGLLLRTWKTDLPAAAAAQNKALEIEPALLAAHDELLSMHYAAGDAKSMRQQWTLLSKALPADVHTVFFFAQTEFLEGRPQRAHDAMLQILKAEPDAPRFLAFAAAVDHRMGALSQAQAKLARLLSLRPQDRPVRLALANVLTQAGTPKKALEVLQPLLAEGQASVDALAIAAEASLLTGDPAGAERFFARAAKARPDDIRVQTALAYRRATTGSGRDSLAALEEIAKRDTSRHAEMALIAAQLRRDDLKAALATLARLEAKQPGSAFAPLMRGNLLLHHRDLAGARAGYERAHQIDPGGHAPVAGLAAVDVAEQKPQDATRRLEQLLASQPSSAPTFLSLTRLYRQMGEPNERVTSMLGKYIAAHPADVEPRIALIEQHLSSQQTKLALAAAQEALALHPDHAPLLYVAGRAQLVAGDPQVALRSFKRLAAVEADSPLSALGQAQVALAQKDLTAAAQQVGRAALMAPKAIEVKRVQIALAVELGNRQQALALARSVQADHPHEAFGHELEGDLHMAVQRWDAAAAAYQQALQRTRSTPDALKRHLSLLRAGKTAEAQAFADAWMARWPSDAAMPMQLGDVAMTQRDWPAAERRYAAVIALLPSNPLAHNNLAWVLLQQQKPGAVAAAERAVALQPKQPEYLDTLAATLARDGQLKRAIELQRSAVSMTPDAVGLRLGLARIATQAGDKTLAREQLDRVATLQTNAAEAAEAEQLRAGLR